MGEVTEEDRKYVCVHITGPSHNYLCLEFSENPDESFFVEVNKKERGCGCGPVVQSELLAAVEQGLNHANNELGTAYGLKRVGYYENDSAITGVYSFLTSKITQHMHNQKKDAE